GGSAEPTKKEKHKRLRGVCDEKKQSSQRQVDHGN
ncbi:hypothetical protein VN97_g12550, partial [Penicillium thymicola]